MIEKMAKKITLALPSKGAIADPTQAFLSECGLKISKPNSRQYTGSISALPDVEVLFQRVKDVNYKVGDGTAELGITGLDVVREYPHDDLVVIHDRLEYGHCKLLVAVPESWIDVDTIADLSDVALDFREQYRRNLRVATTYTNLARSYLHRMGIHHFTVVKAEGAIEAAPTIGYADVVIDLTQTGTTLRENHLKPLADGVIMESQACLIGNRRALQTNKRLRGVLNTMLEYIDGALLGRQYIHLTVNICGPDAGSIGEKVTTSEFTRGLLGPTIAPIYSPNRANANQQWFTVTLTVESVHLTAAIRHLRAIGGIQIVSTPARYVFLENSPTYTRLIQVLGIEDL